MLEIDNRGRPLLIGIAGKMGSGKDTVGAMLRMLCEHTGTPVVREIMAARLSRALRRLPAATISLLRSVNC